MRIPKDWRMKSLSEVSCKIMVGIASAATHAYRESGIIMLRNLNIKENHIDGCNLLFIDPEYEKYHKNKRIKTGDVITVRTGYPGVSAVVTDRFNNAQCFTSLIIRPIPELINSHFLSTYINSEFGRKFISASEAGGAQKNVNAGVLSKMLVPIPPLAEQKKIAEILGAWDDTIALIEHAIGAKRKLKQGLMQQLLTGKKRFKEFEGSEWGNVKLSNFFVEVSKKNNVNEKNIILSCSKVYGIVPQSDIFGKRIASEDTRRYKLVKKNNLVYDPMLLWDASIGFVESVDQGIISPAYNTFEYIGDYRILPYFKHLFKSYQFKEMYKIISQGTNVRRRKAPAKTFLNIEFKFPQSIIEQEKIAATLSAADEEIAALEKQLAAYKQQKRGLMQQLLTGKLRVNYCL